MLDSKHRFFGIFAECIGKITTTAEWLLQPATNTIWNPSCGITASRPDLIGPTETDPHPFLDGFRSKGAVVGAHAGCNWRYGRAVPARWSAADVSGSAQPLSAITPFGLQTHDRTYRLKYLGTARARACTAQPRNCECGGGGGDRCGVLCDRGVSVGSVSGICGVRVVCAVDSRLRRIPDVDASGSQDDKLTSTDKI